MSTFHEISPYLQGTSYQEYQQQQQQIHDDTVRRHILNALNAQYLDFTASLIHSVGFVSHFSQTICPIFRHIPIEDYDLPSGWVSGQNGVRSYFDILNMYWKQGISARQSTITIDTVHRTCQLVMDIDWTWLRRPQAPGWSEVVDCVQMYDPDYKIVKAEYITLSGRDTCWAFMGRMTTSEDMVRDGHLICYSLAHIKNVCSAGRTAQFLNESNVRTWTHTFLAELSALYTIQVISHLKTYNVWTFP